MSDLTAAELATALRVLAGDLAGSIDPLVQLDTACELQRVATYTRDVLARRCVAGGASFAEVGRRVGISREAARVRYPRT